MTEGTELDNLGGQMAENMRESGRMENNMDMESLKVRMERKRRGLGVMGKGLNGNQINET